MHLSNFSLSSALSIASLLAPIAIPVAIIAAIALGIYAIIESFKVFQQKFEETGSAFEAIKAFIIELPTQIFGTLLNLIKGAVGFVVGIFSPDIGEAIADFDFKEVLRNLITGMFNFVQNIGSAIKNFFTERNISTKELEELLNIKFNRDFRLAIFTN